MKTRESTSTLGVVRVCASRGLAREALGLDLIQGVSSVRSCRLSLPVAGGDS